MASRLSRRLASHLLRNPTLFPSPHPHNHRTIFTIYNSSPLISFLESQPSIPPYFRPLSSRFFSTARRQPIRKKVDIGARARQLQRRRLWSYSIAFSCTAGFIVIMLSQFEEHLVFYVTPTDVMAKHSENPSKSKYRLGGLVLEGSVAHPASSPEMEFVVTDLITDMLVRFEGSLPDLFREGHSVVVEGLLKPITEEIMEEVSAKSVSGKARSLDCYFSATEVLAKHDEKYMPKEVAAAIEKNRKKIAAAKIAAAKIAETEGREETTPSS